MSLWPVVSILASGLPFAFPNPVPPEAHDGRARDIAGKNVIVTGANAGLGRAITKELARRGARVTMACRSTAPAEQARQDILSELEDGLVDPSSGPGAAERIDIATLDTSSLASVRRFVNSYEATSANRKVDLLYLNAGIVAVGRDVPTVTDEGLEVVYATNVLGHFLLLHLLEPRLAEDARIISTSSLGGVLSSFSKDFSTEAVIGRVERGFHVWRSVAPKQQGSDQSAYNQTKAMQAYMTRALNNRAAANGSRRIAACFHPGLVSTNIFTVGSESGFLSFINVLAFCERFVGISPEQGAHTPVFLGTATEAALAQHGDRSKIWERSHAYASPYDLMDTERFWRRWCADAGIEETWSI